MSSELEIKDLNVSVDGNKILNGINLRIREGEIHILMGPNGSGKTTLSNTIIGHPKYSVETGSITFDGQDILQLKPDQRAKLGLFLAFQNPIEIPGVKIFNFLKTAHSNLHSNKTTVEEFETSLKEKFNQLNIPTLFMDRYLNEGFSGGEKKMFEILQMFVLKPKIAIIDETDSGLDVDTLKTIAESIKTISKNTGLLIITHYDRILRYIKPDFVHVMIGGRIVKSGGMELAEFVEKNGYESLSTGDIAEEI